MKETIRPLTKEEFTLLRPELETYIAGRQAQDRLARMLQLFAPGADLDIETLTLVREVPDQAPDETPKPQTEEDPAAG